MLRAESYICWEVHDESGQHPWADSGEGWPHHKTSELALAELAERLRDAGVDGPEEVPALTVAQSFPTPCVELVCDGCGLVYEDEEFGGGHLDPADPIWFEPDDVDWTARGDRHYCPQCTPADTAATAPTTATAVPSPGAKLVGEWPVTADQLTMPWPG